MKYEWEKFIVSAREEFAESGKVNEAFADKAKEIFEKFGGDENVDDDEFCQMIGDLDGEDAYSHCFEFAYRHKTVDYSEYDGEQFFAPNEDVAWEIFLGMDGEYKMPAYLDYDCKKVK